MKNKVLIIATILIFSCQSTKKTTEKTNIVANKTILIGIINYKTLNEKPYSDWFSTNYNKYKPNKDVIEKIKPLSKNIEVKIFMGTWCSDTRKLLPKFYKVLDDANFNKQKITLIGMDKNKTTPLKHESNLNITNVPTFIILKNGKEINRIVELAIESPEEDLLKILTKQGYKNIYED